VRVGRFRIPRVRHHLVEEGKVEKRGNRKGTHKGRVLKRRGKAGIKRSKRPKKKARIRTRSKITVQARSRREP